MDILSPRLFEILVTPTSRVREPGTVAIILRTDPLEPKAPRPAL